MGLFFNLANKAPTKSKKWPMPAPAVAVDMIATPGHRVRQAGSIRPTAAPRRPPTLNGPQLRTPGDSRCGADRTAHVPSGRHEDATAAASTASSSSWLIYAHIHPPFLRPETKQGRKQPTRTGRGRRGQESRRRGRRRLRRSRGKPSSCGS
jgi:hypothetical protein